LLWKPSSAAYDLSFKIEIKILFISRNFGALDLSTIPGSVTVALADVFAVPVMPRF